MNRWPFELRGRRTSPRHLSSLLSLPRPAGGPDLSDGLICSDTSAPSLPGCLCAPDMFTLPPGRRSRTPADPYGPAYGSHPPPFSLTCNAHTHTGAQIHKHPRQRGCAARFGMMQAGRQNGPSCPESISGYLDLAGVRNRVTHTRARAHVRSLYFSLFLPSTEMKHLHLIFLIHPGG